MSHHEDHELEGLLRSLPIAGPRPQVRERILRAATATARRTRASALVYAAALAALLVADIAVDRVQSAHLARLIGAPVGAPPLYAPDLLREREMLLIALLERGEMP